MTVIVPLFQNASMLLVLSVILEGIYLLHIRFRRFQLAAIGVLIACVCVVIMSMPYTVSTGIVFDTRTILISVTALTFGLIPTAITAAVAIAYRIYLGGSDMLAGIVIIILCGLIGLGWRRWLYPTQRKWRWLNVYVMSVIVHAVMLACLLTLLAYPENIRVVQSVAVPVLVVYPITAALLSLLLIRQRETIQTQEALKQSEERFRVLFDQAPLGYQTLDTNGAIMDVNQKWLDMMEYPRREVIGKPFAAFLSPDDARDYGRNFEAFKAQGHVQREFTMVTRSAAQRYVRIEGKIRYDADGRAIQSHCILQDITKQREAQERLRASEEKYGSYISNAPNAIMIVNSKGRVIEVNEAAVRISGYSRDTLLTMNLLDTVDAGSMEAGKQMFNNLLGQGACLGEVQFVPRDGSLRWANVSGVKLKKDRYLCFMSDISQRKWAMEKLIYSSSHDSLTGLWNRKYFDAEVERLHTAENLPLSIIIGDINGLKLINDSFGRAEGDRIIGETARLMAGLCRPTDILARTGGDEFSVILPKTDRETAVGLLHSMQAAMEHYNETIANDTLHIHLALGVATGETTEEGFTEILVRAENSMNQRKLLEERSSHSSIIATIKATMREKSHETEAHEERMAQLARKVGVILGLTQVELDHIELLAELHDIGKVGISEQILNKPGKLNEEEWREMKKHPEIGERIAMSTASLAPIAYYILCHHERWDGRGYPQQLGEYQIPLLSRIISIVDAYDAMTQDRVYQKAMSHQAAMAEILRSAGTQFDPRIARIFCEEVFESNKAV